MDWKTKTLMAILLWCNNHCCWHLNVWELSVRIKNRIKEKKNFIEQSAQNADDPWRPDEPRILCHPNHIPVSDYFHDGLIVVSRLPAGMFKVNKALIEHPAHSPFVKINGDVI